jgi:hypothetical protein
MLLLSEATLEHGMIKQVGSRRDAFAARAGRRRGDRNSNPRTHKQRDTDNDVMQERMPYGLFVPEVGSGSV